MLAKSIKSNLVRSIGILLVLLLLPSVVSAMVPIIYTDNSTSLQETIYAAENGDIIMMAPGNYTIPLVSGNSELYINKSDLTFMADGGEVIIIPDPSGGTGEIYPGMENGTDTTGCDASGITFNDITFGDIKITCDPADYEPDYFKPNQIVNNMTFEGCTFLGGPNQYNTYIALYNDSNVLDCTFAGTFRLTMEGHNIRIEGNSGTGLDLYQGKWNIDGIDIYGQNISIVNNTLTNILNFNCDGVCLVENNVVTGMDKLSIYRSSDSIIRNNKFLDVDYKYNRLLGEAYQNEVSNGYGTGARIYMYDDGAYYLNNFTGFSLSDIRLYPATYSTSTPVTYTYGGASHTGYLGNYYSTYTGSDTNTDGVGDDIIVNSYGGSEEYPLMGAWDATLNEIDGPDVLPPMAAFSADITLSSSLPVTVNFTDMSTNVETWSWDFDGDGVEDSTETNPQFTYTVAGIYSVNLTVSNSVGSDYEAKVDYISVGAAEPLAPTGMIDSVGDLYAYMTWPEPDNNGSPISSYNIYRSTVSGAEILYDTVNASTSRYTDHAVSNGQEYFYQISAVNAIGESVFSNELNATPVAEVVDDSWEHFMGDLQHTGYSSTPGPKTNVSLWVSPDIDAEDGASITIADDLGLMFVISDAKDSDWSPTMGYNNLSALNTNDGSVEWDVTFGDIGLGTYNSYDSWATPAYNNGVVFTAGDGARYANNGTLKWGSLPMNTNGGPLVAEGKVIVGNWDGAQYFCFDEETGAQLWNISVNGNAQGTPAYNGSHLFLTSYDEVNCVDMDGNVVWTKAINNVMGSATIKYGLVYITTYDSGYTSDQYVYALEETTGNIVWESTMTSQSMMGTDCTPAVAYGYVYVTAGMAMIDQNTYCFDAFTGEVVWSSSEAGSWFTSPVVSDGVVYAGAESYFSGGGGMGSFTHIAALDAFTGNLIWESDNGGSTPALLNGVLYTVGFQKVYAYSEQQAPVADFNADVTSGNETLTVQFTDLSVNEPDTWAWDFDNDGVTDSTDQNPQYTYTAPGVYTVTLNASNAAGSDVETKVDYITVGDWNPWNDPDSDGLPDGTYITIDEVIEAYGCYIEFSPAPGTGASIDIDRVIELYTAYIEGTPM